MEGDLHEPDPALLAAARTGDLRAFEALVRAYQADVWSIARHVTRNETLADDVTQEAFLRVHRFLPRFQGQSKFSTWLFSIARNCALDELRRGARRHRLGQAAGAEPRPPAGEVGTRVEVREALAALPLDLREPIVLVDLLGLKYSEAAAVMEVAEGTVKSRVHRARKAVAASLGIAREGGEKTDEG